MKAYRTLLWSLAAAALVVLGVGSLVLRSSSVPSSKKPQPIEADPETTESEDEGFRDCPDDAQEQIANEPVQAPPLGREYCIPAVLPFDQAVGPIHAQMTLESLQAVCGDVTADYLFYLGEGQCQWGTALYHGTPREVQIAWRNWKDKKNPSFVHFVGKELHFDNGLGPGMLLKDVVKLNGKPLTLAGFGWEASGFHRSFQGGNLRMFDEASDAHYLIRYALDWEAFDQATDEEHASIVTGEGLLESSLPALEKFKAHVDSIEYVFAAEARATAETRERCRDAESFALKTLPSANAKSIEEAFQITLREPGCDDGVFAGTASHIVVRALAKDFEAAIQYGESDTRVGIFMLRHLDPTADLADLQAIVQQRQKCQNRSRGLCQNIIKEVENTLQNQ